MTARPRFSVILPTRERADTLVSSLRTCTTQDDPDLEIIVSDNFSQDHTREVVKMADDARILYVNPQQRLGMSQNWEFGLSHATGDYVMFLGDDDGLLPDAVEALRELAVTSGRPDAIAWKDATYHWPDHPEHATRGLLTVPLRKSVKVVSAPAMLKDVISMKVPWMRLPWLYRSLVSRTAIDRVIGRSGRFFCSQIPDVYSGIAIASVIDSYYCSERPYAINGASGYSTGTSQFAAAHKGPATLFATEPNIPFHPTLDFASAGPMIVAESYLQALDNNLQFEHKLDMKLVLTESLRSAAHQDPSKYEEISGAVMRTAQRLGIAGEVESFTSAHPNDPRNPAAPVLGYKKLAGTVTVDAEPYGVRNVYEAAQLAEHLWAIHHDGVFNARNTAIASARHLRQHLSNPQRLVRALRENLAPLSQR